MACTFEEVVAGTRVCYEETCDGCPYDKDEEDE